MPTRKVLSGVLQNLSQAPPKLPFPASSHTIHCVCVCESAIQGNVNFLLYGRLFIGNRSSSLSST